MFGSDLDQKILCITMKINATGHAFPFMLHFMGFLY